MRPTFALSRIPTEWLLLAIALSAAACQAAAKGVPADWVLLDAGPFTLRAPPSMLLKAGKGIDSNVGRIEGGSLRIEYDYGGYSDPLTRQDGDNDYSAKEVTIDGRRARLVSFHAPQRYGDRPYVLGVHFPNLGSPGIGAAKLTIVAAAANPDARTTAEQVFGTLRIKPPK